MTIASWKKATKKDVSIELLSQLLESNREESLRDLFVVDDNSKKRKTIDEWEQKRIDLQLQSCYSLNRMNEKEKTGCRM